MNFLQQLFPLYLEALTIEYNNPINSQIGSNDNSSSNINGNISSNGNNGVGATDPSEIVTNTTASSSAANNNNNNNDLSSLDNALPSVAQLANSALVEIWQVYYSIIYFFNEFTFLIILLLLLIFCKCVHACI